MSPLCEAQPRSDLRPSLSTSGSAAAGDLRRLPGAFPLPLLPTREGPRGPGVGPASAGVLKLSLSGTFCPSVR